MFTIGAVIDSPLPGALTDFAFFAVSEDPIAFDQTIVAVHIIRSQIPAELL